MSATQPPGAGVLRPVPRGDAPTLAQLADRVAALEAWRDGTVNEAKVQARVAKEVRAALGLPADASDAEVQAAQARARGEAPTSGVGAPAEDTPLLPDWAKRTLIWLVMIALYTLLARLGILDPEQTPPPPRPEIPGPAVPQAPVGGDEAP